MVLLLPAVVALADINQARSAGLTFLPVNGQVNILSIDFTAPVDGFVLANAVGFCNMLSPVTPGSGSGQAVIGISTAPMTLGDFPQAFLMLPNGLSNGAGPIIGWQQSWATSNVFAVIAGPNTLFVNASATNAGGWSCAAVLTVDFDPAQLP